MFPPNKRCPDCKMEKAAADFCKNSKRYDGLDVYCKACKKLQRQARHASNSEKYSKKRRAAYLANKDAEQAANRRWMIRNREKANQYAASYRKRHPDRVVKAQKKYAKNNQARIADKNARRRAIGSQAQPPWSQRDKVEQIYKLAKMVEYLSGRKVHVDHVVPLVGKNVCGLHCEQNLVPVPALVNLRKGNKFNDKTDLSRTRYWKWSVLTLGRAIDEGALVLAGPE